MVVENLRYFVTLVNLACIIFYKNLCKFCIDGQRSGKVVTCTYLYT